MANTDALTSNFTGYRQNKNNRKAFLKDQRNQRTGMTPFDLFTSDRSTDRKIHEEYEKGNTGPGSSYEQMLRNQADWFNKNFPGGSMLYLDPQSQFSRNASEQSYKQWKDENDHFLRTIFNHLKEQFSSPEKPAVNQPARPVEPTPKYIEPENTQTKQWLGM